MPVQRSRRPADRIRVALRARLTWKDGSGAVRFASVVTRDISESGAFVEVDAKAPVTIPLYRIVHLQLERELRDGCRVPERLQNGRMLSAVWRVAPHRRATGTPEGYALRFLVDPGQLSATAQFDERLAVAS